MRRRWYLGMLALLGLLVVGGVTIAQAGPGAGGRSVIEDENHFRCYIVSQQTPQGAQEVTLEDQFFPNDPQTVTVDEPLQFCAPVAKKHGDMPVFDIEDENEHLTMYPAQHAFQGDVTFTDQFSDGTTAAEIAGARYLLVPTTKIRDDTEFEARRLNHWWCYEANDNLRRREDVGLDDQFIEDEDFTTEYRVEELRLFCNPVEKTHNDRTTRIPEEDVHLACYELHGPQRAKPITFGVENQFETDQFQITAFELLCAPAEKHGFTTTSG